MSATLIDSSPLDFCGVDREIKFIVTSFGELQLGPYMREAFRKAQTNRGQLKVLAQKVEHWHELEFAAHRDPTATP